MAATTDTVHWRGVHHSDADPVPAVRELRATGQLDHTVATRLVDQIVTPEALATGGPPDPR